MTSTAATSTRKRKADEISDDTIDVPHLPAPVWGGILDFMPYGEVRSALLVGKHIAVEAVKYVKTISVLKPEEMHVPASRRFPNIEEVRILCLVQGTGEYDDFDDDQEETFTLSLETAYSTTPFLAGFPKLKEAIIGGRLKRRHGVDEPEFDISFVEYDDYCSGPNNHEEIFQGLVMSLGGAFKTGLLSPDVTITGVYHQWGLVRPCRQSGERTETHSCSWCRNYCKHFPLTHVLRKGLFAPHQNYCLQAREFWAIINGRPGSKEAIRSINEEVLCNELVYRLNEKVLSLRSSDNIPPDVEQHMQTENQSCLRVWWLSRTILSEIDEMIEAGFDPTRIRGKYFRSKLPLESMLQFYGGTEPGPRERERVCNAWTISTVKELSSRGFPIDFDSSIITVDETSILQE